MRWLFSHPPITRLLLGLSLMIAAARLHGMAGLLLISLLALSLLRGVDGDWRTTLRLYRLLRWFVLPTLLLHAFFSPGELLWPELTALPISREGVRHGLWLSLHLLALFATALLLFRLLRWPEWLALLLKLPWLGEYLLIRIWIIAALRRAVAALLLGLQTDFKLRGRWYQLPQLLLAACRDVLDYAAAFGEQLWLRWPQQLHVGAPVTLPLQQSRAATTTISLLWLLAGNGAFWWLFQ